MPEMTGLRKYTNFLNEYFFKNICQTRKQITIPMINKESILVWRANVKKTPEIKIYDFEFLFKNFTTNNVPPKIKNISGTILIDVCDNGHAVVANP